MGFSRCCGLHAVSRLWKKRRGMEPNAHGGQENLESIAFLKKLNEKIFEKFPHAP